MRRICRRCGRLAGRSEVVCQGLLCSSFDPSDLIWEDVSPPSVRCPHCGAVATYVGAAPAGMECPTFGCQNYRDRSVVVDPIRTEEDSLDT